MGIKVKIHPAFFMYSLVFAPAKFQIFICSRVLKSFITYIHNWVFLNAVIAAHTCFQVCKRDAEVEGGCRGGEELVGILQLLLLLELSGWLDKKRVRSRGTGIAISGSRKMHGQGWGCHLRWCFDRS